LTAALVNLKSQKSVNHLHTDSQSYLNTVTRTPLTDFTLNSGFAKEEFSQVLLCQSCFIWCKTTTEKKQSKTCNNI